MRDPRRTFGWGNVVPVVSAKAVAAEGSAFTDTIQRVDDTLTTDAVRQLNYAVSIAGQDPASGGPPVPADPDRPADAPDPLSTLAASRRGQLPLEPKPPAPRSLSVSDATSTGVGSSTRTSTSWAMRSPAASSNGCSRSVLSSSTRTSPR